MSDDYSISKEQEFLVLASSSDLVDEVHSERMDRKYGRVRHFYDISRLLFLWGRNRAIKNLHIQNDMRLIEIGCGTGRNLKRMARKHPRSRIFGIDISYQMLQTCLENLKGLRNARVAKADAMHFDPVLLFSEREFDGILMSFSLSMIPDWKRAIYQALSVLAVDGTLSIVDFGRFESFGHLGKLAIAELGKHQAPPITTLEAELADVVASVAKSFEIRMWRGLGGFNQFATIKRIG